MSPSRRTAVTGTTQSDKGHGPEPLAVEAPGPTAFNIRRSFSGYEMVPSGSRKIAIVSETFPPEINGVANTLHYLCQELLATGHRLQIVRPLQRAEARRPPARPPGTGVLEQVIVAGLPLPGYPELRLGLPCGRRLFRLWGRDRPDAVYVATEGPLGWSAAQTARRLGIPISSGFHTNFHSYSHYYRAGFLQPLITAYLRAFHNRTDATLVPTERMRSRLASLGIERVRVMSRGVDCDLFHPGRRDADLRARWGLDDSDLVVQYVGRLAAEKNLGLAVHCFERLRVFHPRARFMLVGDGPLRRKLQTRYPDYLFCGTRRGEDLARHYASADLFLFPSKTDTFGNVVLEAMASGLAVVGFDDAAVAENIRHEQNGMKSPIDDDEAFIDSVMKLADQPSLLRRVRQGARQTAAGLHWRLVTQIFSQHLLHGQPLQEPPLQEHSSQERPLPERPPPTAPVIRSESGGHAAKPRLLSVPTTRR